MTSWRKEEVRHERSNRSSGGAVIAVVVVVVVVAVAVVDVVVVAALVAVVVGVVVAVVVVAVVVAVVKLGKVAVEEGMAKVFDMGANVQEYDGSLWPEASVSGGRYDFWTPLLLSRLDYAMNAMVDGNLIGFREILLSSVPNPLKPARDSAAVFEDATDDRGNLRIFTPIVARERLYPPPAEIPESNQTMLQ